jgi:2-iminobutanoate/2-iminopropanoate deaminase
MMTKHAFKNKHLPDFSNAFSWGLKITDFSEIFFVTGHGDCDPDFITQHPKDPVGQTKLIFKQMLHLIEEAGFTRQDIVRTDWTFVNEVTSENFADIAVLWEAYLSDIDVKPATGTLRYVTQLCNTVRYARYDG